MVMRTTSMIAIGAAFAMWGCGGGGVNVPEGPMPQGGSYTGVWHSPQYGELQMQQTGSNVVGEYTKDERQGRIQGTVQGNVMRFEWSEERELVAGRPITTRGRGYFRYAIGDDGDHYIRGEWGMDENLTGGGEWNAVRDRRRQPSLRGGGQTESGENIEEFDTADDSGGEAEEGEGRQPRGSDESDDEEDSLDLDGL
jgi:hypothetical protein